MTGLSSPSSQALSEVKAPGSGQFFSNGSVRK